MGPNLNTNVQLANDVEANPEDGENIWLMLWESKFHSGPFWNPVSRSHNVMHIVISHDHLFESISIRKQQIQSHTLSEDFWFKHVLVYVHFNMIYECE